MVLVPYFVAASSAEVTGQLPYDVDVARVRRLVEQGNITAAHRQFARLGWAAFLALNWPAEANGSPSKNRTITDTESPRVWDFWRPVDTIFLDGGATPAPWSDKPQYSAHYHWKSAWRQHTTAGANLEAFSGPLVDQNGHWVRYQARVNREEFDYVMTNQLYSQDGQIRFSQRADGNQVDLPRNVGTKTHGAIEIKLAWKELGPNDDATRFYTRELTAEVSAPPGPDGRPAEPRRFTAGLAGMHISMRTQSSPEWIWSTFEQIDNVRVNRYPDGRPVHPNFFDPSRAQPVNIVPAPNAIVDPSSGLLKVVTGANVVPDKWVEALTTTPVQVQRVQIPMQPALNPLDDALGAVTREVNAEMQRLLSEERSVFQYYELIDVQWPLHPNAPAAAGGANSAPESITHKTPGDMVPVFLVNTTMETYFQKGHQAAGALEQDDRLASGSAPIDATPIIGSESCVGCHYSAGIAIAFKRDIATGKELVDSQGYPCAVYGENAHFGKSGNASFSWILQLEARARKADPATDVVRVDRCP
jgi:hypothetical protein